MTGGAAGGARWGRRRRATQLLVALLYLALPVANAAGHRGLLGSLAATRVGPVELVEPAAAATTLLAGRGGASAGVLLLGAAPLVLLALLLGPVFCSWLCPFGLLSEIIDRLRRRPPFAPLAHVRARAPRAAFLALVLGASAVLALPLGALLQGPRAVTVAAVEGFYLGAVSPFAIAVLGGLLLAELLLPRRLFCRALCPAGALANYLRTPRTLRIARSPAPCTCEGPPRCHESCPWGVDPRHAGRFDGCTSCLACVDACPSGALAPVWRTPPRAPERAGPSVPARWQHAPRLPPTSAPVPPSRRSLP